MFDPAQLAHTAPLLAALGLSSPAAAARAARPHAASVPAATDAVYPLTTSWAALCAGLRPLPSIVLQSRHTAARLIVLGPTATLRHQTATTPAGGAKLAFARGSVALAAAGAVAVRGHLAPCACCGSPGHLSCHDASGHEFLQFAASPATVESAWAGVLVGLAGAVTSDASPPTAIPAATDRAAPKDNSRRHPASHETSSLAPIDNPGAGDASIHGAGSAAARVVGGASHPFASLPVVSSGWPVASRDPGELAGWFTAFAEAEIALTCSLRLGAATHTCELIPTLCRVDDGLLTVAEQRAVTFQLALPAVAALVVAPARGRRPSPLLAVSPTGRVLATFSAGPSPLARTVWQAALHAAFPTLD